MTVASRRGISFIAGLVVAVPLACGDIREDEFQCENAVAHLKACCPGFDATGVACDYVTGCGVTSYPVLDLEQSKCIEGESCDTLRTTGVCDAVAALPYQQGSDAADMGPTVCPMSPAAAPAGSDNAVDAGIALACTSGADCLTGQVCCISVVGTSPSTSCLAPPCPPLPSGLLPGVGAQLCATSAECLAGETCQPLSFVTNVTICTLDSDGSADATEDVRDGDRPPADATALESSESAANSGDPAPEASPADSSTPEGGGDALGDEQ